VTPELKKIIDAHNKKHPGSIVLAKDIIAPPPRFTTGSVSLDVILGGGWPPNQWHELIGEPSHGKTAIALKTLAACQAKDPEFQAVWIAAESWVPDYAEMCGVDPERVLVVQSNIMEEAYGMTEDFAKSKQIDCVIIDSLPALVPSAEDAKDMGESTVGRGALLTNQFFRKIGPATKRSLVSEERPFLGIVINQWRMKIGVMYGDPRTTPGGVGKDFAYFTRVEVRRDEWIEENKEKVGQTIKARTIKNKSFPPYQTAYMDFYFADGQFCPKGSFDYAKELVALGSLNGLITRGGSWYTYGDIRVQGLDAMLQAIREEPSARDQLEKEVLQVTTKAIAHGSDTYSEDGPTEEESVG
jgi:recombination protein RecA